MIRKIFVLAFACLFSLFGLTACSTSAPMPAPTKPVASPVETAESIAIPSASPSAPSDDQLKKEQVAKFAYMQDANRLQEFEASGYKTAKVMIAKDVMSGKYGKPVVQRITLFDQPALDVSVGKYDDKSALFAQFYVDLDKSDNPNWTTVWNFTVMAPGHEFVMITDSVHDWPTTIDGKSVDLQYSVAYGETSLDTTMSTCIWPNIEQERMFCQNDDQTRVMEDMSSADYHALRIMAETMSDLYGPMWYKG